MCNRLRLDFGQKVARRRLFYEFLAKNAWRVPYKLLPLHRETKMD